MQKPREGETWRVGWCAWKGLVSVPGIAMCLGVLGQRETLLVLPGLGQAPSLPGCVGGDFPELRMRPGVCSAGYLLPLSALLRV